MTRDERNRLIHERLFGRCWHEWRGAPSGLTCTECGYRVAYHTSPPSNPDYHTGNGMMEVLSLMRSRKLFVNICVETPNRVTIYDATKRVARVMDEDLPTAVLEAAIKVMEDEHGKSNAD